MYCCCRIQLSDMGNSIFTKEKIMYPYYEKEEQESTHLFPNCNFNSNFPPHMHSFIEFFYVLEGEVSVKAGRAERLMKKGDCVLIFPNQVHSYTTTTDNRGFIILFSQTFAGIFLQMFYKYRPENPFLTADQVPADIRLAAEKMLEPSNRFNQPVSSAWLQVILANIMPLYTLVESPNSPENKTFFRVMQYIAENYRSPLTLKTVSQALRISEYYLSHLISENLHMNFREYVNGLRLDYAIQLIQSTRLPLTHIWTESGFESQTTFNRVFRQVMNTTPSQYRADFNKRS